VNPYPEYVNSGLSWLGKIPKHWKAKRLKYLAQANQEALPESTANNYEFNYVDIGNVGLEEGLKLGERINFANAPSRARRIVRNGDTIVSTVRTYLKAVAHIDFEPKDIVCSTGFAVISPGAVLAPKFLYYILRSEKVIDRVEALSVGVSYPAINASELMGIAAWYPPSLDEQKDIADYLDRKTAQIDALILKKEKLIELLKEERAAIINQAVTKGLDSKVALKNSSIPWLGKVPKHWRIEKLKFNARVRFSNVNKKTEEGEIPVKLCNYVDVYYNSEIGSDIAFMEASASLEEINKFQLKAGDVLITKDSEEWTDIAVPAHVGVDMPNLLCGYHLAQIRSGSRLNGNFLFWLLSSNQINYQFKIEASGVTRYGLSNYALDNSIILLPSIEEQQEIANFLKAKTAQIYVQITTENKAIKYLKEYRTALISEVVTGKIDVREI